MSQLTLVRCFSLLYLLLEADAGRSAHFPGELSDDGRCNFNISRTYNVTDLLRCMNELADDSSARSDAARSWRQPSRSDSDQSPYDFPYASLISSLFNNAATSTYDDDSPSSSAADYYRPSQPTVPGANLLDALSSISRHDDLKCVSRILCEAASGRLRGEYGRASTFLDNFVGSALNRWLVGLDVPAGMPPLLNFARAAALGYGGRGDSTTCYRAYPRCPRNPDKLVHYLNNHNGGFFRFFGENRRESYPQQSPYASQGNKKFLARGSRRKALPPGYAGAETDRTGTGELKFDTAAFLSARQDDGRSFFPKDNTAASSSGREVAFPIHEEELSDRPRGGRILKSSAESESTDASALSRDRPSFFPREDQQDVRVLRLTARPPIIPHDTFRFPR